MWSKIVRSSFGGDHSYSSHGARETELLLVKFELVKEDRIEIDGSEASYTGPVKPPCNVSHWLTIFLKLINYLINLIKVALNTTFPMAKRKRMSMGLQQAEMHMATPSIRVKMNDPWDS